MPHAASQLTNKTSNPTKSFRDELLAQGFAGNTEDDFARRLIHIRPRLSARWYFELTRWLF